jgi:catechol 2,3-dioxygenase-like lactoylglutathione lyase family enzyme
MKMEHIGIQVNDPVQMSAWYCRHLGFRVMRQQAASPFTAFLADSSGSMMIEIHHHLEVPMPEYRQMDPLLLHLAFDVGDEPIETAAQRLIAAGASLAKDLVISAAGDKLLMLRDPWGLAIQLVKRAQSMI